MASSVVPQPLVAELSWNTHPGDEVLQQLHAGRDDKLVAYRSAVLLVASPLGCVFVFFYDTAIRLYIHTCRYTYIYTYCIYTYTYIHIIFIYIHIMYIYQVNLPGSVDFSLSNGAQLAAQAFYQSCPTCSRW